MNNNEYFFNKYAIEDLNNFGILQNNMMSNINLYQQKEGFEKGNLFPSLYEQYKNYSPANLIARTEQERMFRKTTHGGEKQRRTGTLRG